MMRPVRLKQPLGFTLLEVLLAIGIFALVSTASFGMLQQTLFTHQGFEQKSARLRQLQRAYTTLERDLSQPANRSIRDAFGDTAPPMRSEQADWGQAFEVTVYGRRNPLQKPRSDLQRVRYFFDGKNVVRRGWLRLDQDKVPVYSDQILIQQVDTWKIDYLVSGEWLQRLDEENIENVSAVKFEIGFANQQHLKWVFYTRLNA